MIPPDVDVLTARAEAAGADVFRPPADYPYGRMAAFVDPFGHRWMLSGPAPVADPVRPGDVVYVSLLVPDAEAARRFFGEVLGWRYEAADPAADPGGVAGARPAHGFAGGVMPPSMLLCFTVDDIDAGMARVVAAGGTAGAVRRDPWGPTVDCTDDQDLPFALTQPPQGAPATPRPSSTALGDVAYLTVLVPDTARFRAFTESVIGWQWNPGRIEDGWEPAGTWPLVGVAGGHVDDPAVVPMYRVADIDAAVARVRALGGRASDPERQSYGITAECTDDQGTRFYLGQLPA